MKTTVDVILTMTDHVKRGQRYFILCPFHEEDTPSMMVDERGAYCFGCGRWSNLDELERKIRNLPPKRKKIKKEKFQWPFPEGTTISNFNFFRKDLEEIQTRGITKYQILQDKETGNLYIPVYDSTQNLYAVVARTTGNPKYVILRGAGYVPILVPNWEKFQKEQFIFMPFGVFDTLSIHELDFATATPLHGMNTKLPVSLFEEKIPIILPDKGEEVAAYRMSARLGGVVIMPPYNEDEKDINDMLIKRKNFLQEFLTNLPNMLY